jgi:hypothetical protein
MNSGYPSQVSNKKFALISLTFEFKNNETGFLAEK